MQDPQMLVNRASFAVIPCIGSAGLTLAEVAAKLDAAVLRAPDEPGIPAMAAELAVAVADLPRPRVLIGVSMGAMVSLEIARNAEVDVLVLVAAGFGIAVSDGSIEWVVRNPPGIFEKLAGNCVADREDEAKIGASSPTTRRARMSGTSDSRGRWPHTSPGPWPIRRRLCETLQWIQMAALPAVPAGAMGRR